MWIEDEEPTEPSEEDFASWSNDEIAARVVELADGMGDDLCERFDGYWGAAVGLRIARAFIEMGDCPEANEVAVTQIGVLARYALDSAYWGNDDAPVTSADCDSTNRSTVEALVAIECAAAPVMAMNGTVDWRGLHRHARG